MTATLHELKCHPAEFDAVENWEKVHEFRKDDRGFAVGDILHLRRWDPATQEYTGALLLRKITYKGTGFGIPDGYCVLSLGSTSPDEIEDLRKEIDEYVTLTDRLSKLLREIANVLRGPPGELSTWGFTGLDEIARKLIAERDAARSALAERESIIVRACSLVDKWRSQKWQGPLHCAAGMDCADELLAALSPEKRDSNRAESAAQPNLQQLHDLVSEMAEKATMYDDFYACLKKIKEAIAKLQGAGEVKP